jgi:hypothetical protein
VDALEEGLIPVALTGHFLRNLTCRGFLWLPGLRYTHSGVPGDIDIVASCDGHLVLAECKSRDQSDPSTIEWPKIVDQVRTLAVVGRACRASFVVFSSMIDQHPTSILGEITSIGGSDLPVHVLSKTDLEEGYRWVKEDRFTMPYPLPLDDLLPEAFPEVAPPQFDKPREIMTAGMIQSIGPIHPPLGEQRGEHGERGNADASS